MSNCSLRTISKKKTTTHTPTNTRIHKQMRVRAHTRIYHIFLHIQQDIILINKIPPVTYALVKIVKANEASCEMQKCLCHSRKVQDCLVRFRDIMYCFLLFLHLKIRRLIISKKIYSYNGFDIGYSAYLVSEKRSVYLVREKVAIYQ